MSDEGMSDDDVRAVLRSAAMICAVHAPSESGLQPALHAIAARLDTITATLVTVTAERDALHEALDSIAVYGDDTPSGPVSEAAYRHWHRDGVRVMRDRARAALTANHSAPVVEE